MCLFIISIQLRILYILLFEALLIFLFCLSESLFHRLDSDMCTRTCRLGKHVDFRLGEILN